MQDLQQYVLDQPLPTEVFFSLVEATASLVGVSEAYWQSKGINGARIRILVEMMKEGGTVLPSVLASRIGVTKPNISLLLTPLEQDGLINRASHPNDGRKTVISITSKGRSLLVEHLPENRRMVAEKLNVLDTQELQQLRHLLTKLRRI
ncbi:MarR family winged helix-turn-helix transcriptional regulator [Paenibacillus rigui]|uniref:MarR family transcriptional regulator n=1 Tax=Paenibacillus rigui TaxID=554312 RepID=A0A229UNU0_9BACL|nr:MarR family transcriptional regulator [Paenibacillus rigui]OXM85177.1 MarR family transcriptional regulator [Paenibacillus rigui]